MTTRYVPPPPTRYGPTTAQPTPAAGKRASIPPPPTRYGAPRPASAVQRMEMQTVKIFDVTGENLRQIERMNPMLALTPPLMRPPDPQPDQRRGLLVDLSPRLFFTQPLSVDDLLQLRKSIKVSGTGYRSQSWRSHLTDYLEDANKQYLPIHERATALAAHILAHDVFEDGNGRTAIIAIYKLYDCNGFALNIEPYLVWTAIAANQNSTTEYARNITTLGRVLKKHTVERTDSKALKLTHAISGIARLQDMRKNWEGALKTSRHSYMKDHSDNPTQQADWRRLNRAKEFMRDLGKSQDVLKRGPVRGTLTE